MSTPVRRGIYGKLTSDWGAGSNTLRALLATSAPGWSKPIYHHIAPDTAEYPFIVFWKESGLPVEAMQDPSAFENDIWVVKCIDDEPSADRAEAVAARVQTLLNDATFTISGAELLYLRRQGDVEYSEEQDGVLYRHAGARYRLVYT